MKLGCDHLRYNIMSPALRACVKTQTGEDISGGRWQKKPPNRPYDMEKFAWNSVLGCIETSVRAKGYADFDLKHDDTITTYIKNFSQILSFLVDKARQTYGKSPC